MLVEPAGLAVIAAMAPEADLVRRRLRRGRKQAVPEVGQLWRGQVGSHRVVLCRSGMGEERASAALQWLVEHEPLWGVMNIGFAGGLLPELATGDVVLADRIQAWPQSSEPGGEGAFIAPNARLGSLAAQAAEQAGLSRHQGLLLSHKTLLPGAVDKYMLGRSTGALAVDMESYPIASLAATYDLPFICLRAILDPCGMELNLPLDGLSTPDGGVRPSQAALAVVRQPGLLKSFWALWRLSQLTQHRLAVWLDHFFAMLNTLPSIEDEQRS